MKQLLLFLIFSVPFFGFAQNVKVLKGQIVADSKDLGGINVGNLSSKKEVSTNAQGVFLIYAKTGDTLLFTSVHLKSKKIIIEKDDFDYLPFLVKMELKVTQLKEVVVENNINAVSLGIVPKGMKTYTPAERRYYTATTGSGLLSVDAILNAISGRTSMIKKEIVVERNQKVQNRLGNMYDEAFFIKELNIPQEYVEGFIVYAGENKRITAAVKDKNKTLTTFLLGEIATEYLKSIADEK